MVRNKYKCWLFPKTALYSKILTSVTTYEINKERSN